MEKIDYQLMELDNKLNYWRWKYQTSHPFFKNEYFEKYQKAREEYGAYYRVNYPKPNIELKPFKPELRMSDWTEQFENFEN